MKDDFRINAVQLRDQITSPARTILLVLLAASGLIFVIACSNVANLILARSVRREGELAVRAALGASRGALRRTLLAESVLLCGAGALLGVLIARPMLSVIARYASRYSVRALDLTRRQHAAVGRRQPRADFVGAARLHSTAAVGRCGRRPGPVERQRPHHDRHQPPPAPVRGHADRRVVRAARRRRRVADDVDRAAADEDRREPEQRAGRSRAGQLRAAAGADAAALSRSDPQDRRAARRRTGRDRHDRAVARSRRVLRRAVHRRGLRQGRWRGRSARELPHGVAGILQVAWRADHRRPRLQRRRSRRQREGRDHQRERGAPHVQQPGRGQPQVDVDRSGDEVHRHLHRRPPHRRHRRRSGRREHRARARR